MQAIKGINEASTNHVNSQIDDLSSQVLNRKIKSPQEIAHRVLELFQCVIELVHWRSPHELHATLKQICENLVKKDRMNFVVRNCSERILKLVKNLCDQENVAPIVAKETDTTHFSFSSLKQLGLRTNKNQLEISDPSTAYEKLVSGVQKALLSQPDFSREAKEDFKSKLLDQIHEIVEDIESSRENVTNQAREHINDNDLILTYSTSETLIQFFREARKTVRFELIVLETAPTFVGHNTAKHMAEAGIQTSLVSDSSVFAVMSRVDKVIISAHGIMANGGIIGATGALMIALAA